MSIDTYFCSFHNQDKTVLSSYLPWNKQASQECIDVGDEYMIAFLIYCMHISKHRTENINIFLKWCRIVQTL